MLKFGMLKKTLLVGLAALTVLSVGTVEAKKAEKPHEYPIGVMQEAKQEPYSVMLTYAQPCAVEPEGATLPVKKADFHLKAAVVAKDDKAGVSPGERITGLQISYKLIKQETGQFVEGVLLPLEDEKGPYYGTNIKLFDGGTYKCIFAFAREPRAAEGDAVAAEQLTWVFKFVPRKKW